MKLVRLVNKELDKRCAKKSFAHPTLAYLLMVLFILSISWVLVNWLEFYKTRFSFQNLTGNTITLNSLAVDNKLLISKNMIVSLDNKNLTTYFEKYLSDFNKITITFNNGKSAKILSCEKYIPTPCGLIVHIQENQIKCNCDNDVYDLAS